MFSYSSNWRPIGPLFFGPGNYWPVSLAIREREPGDRQVTCQNRSYSKNLYSASLTVSNRPKTDVEHLIRYGRKVLKTDLGASVPGR